MAQRRPPASRLARRRVGPRAALVLRIECVFLSWLEREFSRKRQFGPDDQRRLRDVLEILALALRVDPRECMEMACANNQFMSPLSGEPFQNDEHLSVVVQAVVPSDSLANEEIYKGFFADWSHETASEAFQMSYAALAMLVDETQAMRGQRFKLTLQLSIQAGVQRSRRLSLAPLIGLLQDIDRTVFRVAQINLSISSSTFEMEELTEFIRLLHSFRGEANVEIK